MHQRDSACAFAHGGSDPLDRSTPHITDREDPRQAGLERQRGATLGPACTSASLQVRPCEYKPHWSRATLSPSHCVLGCEPTRMNKASAETVRRGYTESRDLNQANLAPRRRVLGEDHPDTLNSAHNLAITLRKLGNVQAARDLIKIRSTASGE